MGTGCSWASKGTAARGRAGPVGTELAGSPAELPCLLHSLQELEGFIKEATAGLTKPVEEGDYDGLVEVMGHLMRVKDRQATTDGMFEPLKETIALLSTYGEEMPEEIHLQLQVRCSRPQGWAGVPRGQAVTQRSLQELPEHWDNTKKLSFRVKQNVAPLQTNEVNIIRRKCQQFEVPTRVWERGGGKPAAAREHPCALHGPPAPRPRLPQDAVSPAGPAAGLQGEVPGKSPVFVH